jgi:hypothetical protein
VSSDLQNSQELPVAIDAPATTDVASAPTRRASREARMTEVTVEAAAGASPLDALDEVQAAAARLARSLLSEPPRVIGSSAHPSGEDAPGRYVHG